MNKSTAYVGACKLILCHIENMVTQEWLKARQQYFGDFPTLLKEEKPPV